MKWIDIVTIFPLLFLFKLNIQKVDALILPSMGVRNGIPHHWNQRHNQRRQLEEGKNKNKSTAAAAPRRMLSMDDTRNNSKDMNNQSRREKFQKVLFYLNSSTKWLITVGNTVLVWIRPYDFRGPYILVGSLVAVYFTDFLKKVFNQERPEGSYLADPGMPSSHALVSFFLAVTWSKVFHGTAAGGGGAVFLDGNFLLSLATIISLLRVICGYHSILQIAVGGIIGSILGNVWLWSGEIINLSKPRLTWSLSWSAYLVGSIFYIFHRMHKWVGQEKHM